MATASPAALDEFIRRFTTQIDTGFGVISGEVQTVLGTLVVISIALTAILWAIDETQNVLASLVRKVLLVGFFAWLVGSWHTLSLTVVNGFGQLGLRAAGVPHSRPAGRVPLAVGLGLPEGVGADDTDRRLTDEHRPPAGVVGHDRRERMDLIAGGPEDVLHVLLGDVYAEVGDLQSARAEYVQVGGASAFAAEQVKLRLAGLEKGAIPAESIALVRMGTGTRCAMCHAPGTDH